MADTPEMREWRKAREEEAREFGFTPNYTAPGSWSVHLVDNNGIHLDIERDQYGKTSFRLQLMPNLLVVLTTSGNASWPHPHFESVFLREMRHAKVLLLPITR